MPPWTCPACNRSFGRKGQQHFCAPAMPVASYLDRQPSEYRGVYSAVLAHLSDLGPLEIEAVNVGVLVKRSRTFVELRPRRGGVRISLKLTRRIDSPRVARTVRMPRSNTIVEFIDLSSPEEVDSELRSWLTESYAASGP